MKTLLKISAAVIGLALVLAQAPTANALYLELYDGTATTTVYDNQFGDLDSTVGSVVFLGSIGVWDINVSTGVSQPILGGPLEAAMDLNSIDHSTAAGTLRIRLVDDFLLGAMPTTGALAIGGTTDGTLTYNAQYFFWGSYIDQLGPFGPGAFSGSSTKPLPGAFNPFGVAQEVFITHDEAGTTSFDASLDITQSRIVAMSFCEPRSW